MKDIETDDIEHLAPDERKRKAFGLHRVVKGPMSPDREITRNAALLMLYGFCAGLILGASVASAVKR